MSDTNESVRLNGRTPISDWAMKSARARAAERACAEALERGDESGRAPAIPAEAAQGPEQER
jgi:hypothetical protein